jgi:hypothetical protein
MNSTVTLLLDQLRRESQRQKEDGSQARRVSGIMERIGQIERAFTSGSYSSRSDVTRTRAKNRTRKLVEHTSVLTGSSLRKD